MGDEVEPGQALLRGLDEVDPLAADVDGVAAHLGDRLGGTGEQVGAVADHVPGPVVATGLLIGEEGDDEVASRTHPLGQHGPDGGDDHRVHVLHVHGPAPPQQTVLDHACEGIDAPVLGRGRDHIRVAVDDQGRSLRIRALDPGDEVGSTGRGLDDLGVQVDLGEPGGDELSGRQFRVRPIPSPVLSVDADELAAQFRDLRLGGAEIRHWRLPSVVVDHSSRLSPE